MADEKDLAKQAKAEAKAEAKQAKAEAKANKHPELTPEEKKAKKIRRSNGWVRFWAIFCALALTIGITYGAKTYAGKMAGEDDTTTTTAPSRVSSTPSGSGGSSSGGSGGSGSEQTTAAAGSSSSSGDSAPSSDAAKAAETINTAMAAAAKVGYHWTRTGKITKDVDVGNATTTLDSLIGLVAKGENINSVVGGFLGAKGNTDDQDVPAGGDLRDPNDESKEYYHFSRYKLMATKLKADDLGGLKVDGDTYKFTIPATTKAPEDGDGQGFTNFTSDFVTKSMIEKEIGGFGVDCTINEINSTYGPCDVEITIKDGKVTNVKYSYDAEVDPLNMTVGKAFIKTTVNGKGGLHVDGEYKDFKY